MQTYWNDKLKNTRYIANCIAYNTLVDRECYAYKVDNSPVGLMVAHQFELEGYLSIEYLVAHPDAEGCGGAMIEYAVNRSVAMGKQGKLFLKPLPDAIPPYKAMGFSGNEDGMHLDPATSAKWCTNNRGEWKLGKYVDQGYMTTIAFEGTAAKLQ